MHIQSNRHAVRRSWIKPACILAGCGAALLIWRRIFMDVGAIIFGAVLIAFLLCPMCSAFERKLSRPCAALLTLALTGIVFALLAAFLLPALLRQMMQLIDLLPNAFARLGELTDSIRSWLNRRLPGLQAALPEFSAPAADLADAARSAVSTIGGFAGGIYRIFLMTALGYFLLRDRERILLRLELYCPLKWRRNAVRAGKLLLRQLRLYLRGQATIALAVGTLAAGAMVLLGLDGALLLGCLVGICNVLPYFGPFLGGIPAVIAALGIGWQRALMTVLALFLVQQADGMLISPRVMGSITGFSPAVVLIALFAGAHIGGIWAMMLTLPALMAFRTVYRVFVQVHEKN